MGCREYGVRDIFLQTQNERIRSDEKDGAAEVKNQVLFFLPIAIVIAADLFAGENKKAAGPRAISPRLAGDTISKEALAELRSKARSESPSLNRAAGFVAPDTQHTRHTTYDYGWNSPTRTFVKADISGGVHIVVTIQELLDSSDRRVAYHYNIGRGAGGDENNVDVTAAGEFANMPTVSPTSADIAWIMVNLRGASPSGTSYFYCDLLPGLGLFTGNGGNVQGGAFGQFAMSYLTDRAWVISYLIADSLSLAYTDDCGATWTLSTGLAWDMTYAGRFAGSGIAVSYDGGKVAVFETFSGAAFAVGDTVPNVHQYSVSDDDGATWTKVPVYWSGPRDDGSYDPFVTSAGISDSLDDGWTGPWLGTDLVFDYLGDVHMVYANFALEPSDSVAPFKYGSPILHYSSARGEGVANMIELTDTDLSHSAGYSAGVDSGYFIGNFISFGSTPTIAAAPDGPVLMAMWSQPDLDGTLGGTNVASTGYWVTDVWGAVSYDAGNSWSMSFQITATPSIAETWTTLDPVLEPNGDGTYTYHALWLQDNSAGILVFDEGDSTMNPWVYATDVVIFPIGIEDEKDGILRSFTLKQNFPNPFNPATRIDFSLETTSDVNLTIFNMLGQEVITLVDEVKAAGDHIVTWNASDVASGVYFYKLTTGDLTLTKKMVLLK